MIFNEKTFPVLGYIDNEYSEDFNYNKMLDDIDDKFKWKRLHKSLIAMIDKSAFYFPVSKHSAIIEVIKSHRIQDVVKSLKECSGAIITNDIENGAKRGFLFNFVSNEVSMCLEWQFYLEDMLVNVGLFDFSKDKMSKFGLLTTLLGHKYVDVKYLEMNDKQENSITGFIAGLLFLYQNGAIKSTTIKSQEILNSHYPQMAMANASSFDITVLG